MQLTLEEQEAALDKAAKVARVGKRANWGSEAWDFGNGIVIVDNEDGQSEDGEFGEEIVRKNTFTIFRDHRRESVTGKGDMPDKDDDDDGLIEEVARGAKGAIHALIKQARALAR